MPLPLTVSCFSKIHTGFTFLVVAHLGSTGKRAVKRVCVCVCVCFRVNISMNTVDKLLLVCVPSSATAAGQRSRQRRRRRQRLDDCNNRSLRRARARCEECGTPPPRTEPRQARDFTCGGGSELTTPLPQPLVAVAMCRDVRTRPNTETETGAEKENSRD